MSLCECRHRFQRHERKWIYNRQKGSKRRAFLCREYISDPTDPGEVVACDCSGFVEKNVCSCTFFGIYRKVKMFNYDGCPIHESLAHIGGILLVPKDGK